jgi:hypothetical protein
MSSGTKMPREWHRAYEAKYYSLPENKARRAAQMREYARNPILRPRHKARWIVNRRIASGRLVRGLCEICGVSETQAHHDDYSKPLEVRWFCRTHHLDLHRQAEGK